MKSFKLKSFAFSWVLCLCSIMPFLLFTACEQDDQHPTGSNDGQHVARGETLKPLVGGKLFSSDTAGYSLSFPESWTINSGERGLVTGRSEPEDGSTVGASVTVFPGALDSPMSATDVMTRYVAGMKKDGGFETTEEHHGQVNGRDAVWFVVDINHNGELRRGLVLGATEGKTAYILTCSTLPEKFDSIRPTVEGVVGTFKVTQ
jgi:hypothetical protein